MLLGQQDWMYIGAVVVAGGGGIVSVFVNGNEKPNCSINVAGGGATRYGGKAGNGESIVGTVLSGNFVTFE